MLEMSVEMAKRREVNKRPKTYGLRPDVIDWITQQAIQQSVREGRTVSASEVLEQLISEAKARQEKGKKKP
jgi:hypothetical protein